MTCMHLPSVRCDECAPYTAPSSAPMGLQLYPDVDVMERGKTKAMVMAAVFPHAHKWDGVHNRADALDLADEWAEEILKRSGL